MTARILNVVIVGAGPAGIGMALALQQVPGLKYCLLEAGEIGESFARWPAQTRLITPSFYSNPFGLADLNAVNESSSPALHAGTEHLSGPQYANYLKAIANQYRLPVKETCRVNQVEALDIGGFMLTTDYGELYTDFLIWATGEYQFPNLSPFPGGQWCPHYAHITDWQSLQYSYCTIIGGYESGIDAAAHLIALGHHVRLLVRRATWDLPDTDDPSLVLSPYSRERLRKIATNDRLDIMFGVNVIEVSQESTGHFRTHAADGRFWDSEQPPILCTGFLKGGGAQQIAELWHQTDDGYPQLTDQDESTSTPGLFLVGPQVRQDQRIYCFIYKFRQRFSLIATHIAHQLQLNINDSAHTPGNWGPFGNSECCEGCEC